MMPIRRGDGTGLSVPGFSEVRTGDGTVLWSAGADIPDSVVRQYDARNISGSDGDAIYTWGDEQANADLTQATSSEQPTLRTNVINSNPVVRFDGSDDELDDGGTLNLTEPFVIQWVGQLRLTDGSYPFYGVDSSDSSVFGGVNGGNWQLSDTNGNVDGSVSDTNAHIFSFIHDSSGSKIRLDQADDGSGAVTPDSQTANILVLGNRAATRNIPAPWDAGIVLIHDSPTSQQIADGEAYLSNQYGV